MNKETANEIAYLHYSRPDLKNIAEQLKAEIIEYAKNKCKQQREICAKIKGFGHQMKNAPKPDFK